MATNLLAYIPTLNQRHLSWFEKHPDSDIYLIPQKTAVKLLPRLDRNLAALPDELVARAINSLDLRSYEYCASVFGPMLWGGMDPRHGLWIMPDEDVSHLFAEKYLLPEGHKVQFEMIWARWDMQAVIAKQPVIADVEISESEFDRDVLKRAAQLAEQSPDWWRQVGAIILTGKSDDSKHVVAAFNTHMPNEYETYIFGDPAINRDAGQKGKSCALHAEAAAIAACASQGIRCFGSKIYVTTFPCEGCAGIIAAAEISEVYFKDGYSSLNALETLRSNGIRIVQVK